MSKRLPRLVMLLTAAVVVGTVCWFVFSHRTTSDIEPNNDPRPVHFSDLPRLLYARGEYHGERVRVAFPYTLTPTADPLVFHFHPGRDRIAVPPTYRLHFDSPPDPSGPLPLVVVGTVAGLDTDLVIRTNGVPGLVVLAGCSAVPPASP